MIAIEDLSVIFNRDTPIETRALTGLSLDIAEGQFVTVIGSNGAGKSTLLNALTGDATPDRGRVVIDGVDVTDWPAPRRAQLAARVFQDPMAGTCDTLTIEENLALAATRGTRRGFARAIDKTRRQDFATRIDELGLGLEGRLTDRMGLLSGGQRQAVSLIMAALQPMKILLLDEHTASLDPKTAAFVLDLTREIVAAKRLTTLMVTHSMRQALDIGDRTVMLHQGRVVLDVAGDQRAALDVPDLLRLFERVRGEKLDEDALLLD